MSWVIRWNQRRCAQPRSLLLSRTQTRRPPHVQPHPLLPQGMLHRRPPPPSKQAVSPERIFLSSPMERCAVQQATHSRSRNGGKRLMGACGWCLLPAFAVVVPVNGVSSANGRGAPRKSRVRSVCSCIPSLSGVSHFSGRTGAERFIGGRACNCCVTNTEKCRCSRASLPTQIVCLLPCRVHSAPILASIGFFGSLATRASQQRSRSRANASESQTVLPPGSVGIWRNVSALAPRSVPRQPRSLLPDPNTQVFQELPAHLGSIFEGFLLWTMGV